MRLKNLTEIADESTMGTKNYALTPYRASGRLSAVRGACLHRESGMVSGMDISKKWLSSFCTGTPVTALFVLQGSGFCLGGFRFCVIF